MEGGLIRIPSSIEIGRDILVDVTAEDNKMGLISLSVCLADSIETGWWTAELANHFFIDCRDVRINLSSQLSSGGQGGETEDK